MRRVRKIRNEKKNEDNNHLQKPTTLTGRFCVGGCDPPQCHTMAYIKYNVIKSFF